jgi:L,D-transpeptidase YcbB
MAPYGKDRNTQLGSARPTDGLRTRRALLRGLSVALVASAAPALAQDRAQDWAKTIFGGTSSLPPPEERAKKAEIIDDLRPNTVPYRSEAMVEALEAAINRYQKIVERGGWPTIPGTKMIRPEDDDDRLPVLRQRLQVTGELRDGGKTSGYVFDAELGDAVKKFQRDHGLRISGRVDKPTLQAMNVPAQARLQQLKLNLGRLRELMQNRIEDRYVLVNPPAFQLEAVERHEVQQRHRVIAGRVERQTPIVKASIRALNFFPYWRVPDSVATLDLIPKMQKEPEYIAREKIRVIARDFNGPELDQANVDWKTATATQIKFRQDPGPQNALGLMRIDMPNSEGVYMHDTPMKQLFQQRARAFSAGCVRVQDVFKLGEWIAKKELGWEQPGRIEGIIEGGQPLDLTLTHQIPVYFTYITAWAEPGGSVQFRPDLYGRDGAPTLVAGRDRDESDPPPPPQSLAP